MYRLACLCCCDFHVSVACESGIESQPQHFWVDVHDECDVVYLQLKLCSAPRRARGEESACRPVRVENEAACLSPCIYFI